MSVAVGPGTPVFNGFGHDALHKLSSGGGFDDIDDDDMV